MLGTPNKQTVRICWKEPSAHARAERDRHNGRDNGNFNIWLGTVQCIDTEDTEWVHGTTEEETHILRKIFVNLKMEGQIVKFQADRGATCNVIGSQDIPQGVRLSPTTKVLRLYDATPIKILRAFQARLMDPATGKYCILANFWKKEVGTLEMGCDLHCDHEAIIARAKPWLF